MDNPLDAVDIDAEDAGSGGTTVGRCLVSVVCPGGRRTALRCAGAGVHGAVAQVDAENARASRQCKVRGIVQSTP